MHAKSNHFKKRHFHKKISTFRILVKLSIAKQSTLQWFSLTKKLRNLDDQLIEPKATCKYLCYDTTLSSFAVHLSRQAIKNLCANYRDKVGFQCQQGL